MEPLLLLRWQLVVVVVLASLKKLPKLNPLCVTALATTTRGTGIKCWLILVVFGELPRPSLLRCFRSLRCRR
jgi:hypothetical protein